MSFAVISFVNVIFITIMTTFLISTKGMRIKRIFVEMPIILLDSAVVSIGDDEDIEPYLSLDLVKHNVNTYLVKNLQNECSKYYISFYPYKVVTEDNKANYYLDLSEKIKNIQIHFFCNYFDNFNVDFYEHFSLENKGVIKDEY